MSEDEKVYKQAMERMDELVEEVIQICIDVADENHYEREWSWNVLELSLIARNVKKGINLLQNNRISKKLIVDQL